MGVLTLIRKAKALALWRRTMRDFERRIADRRAGHQSTKDIEAERRAFAHTALRGRS